MLRKFQFETVLANESELIQVQEMAKNHILEITLGNQLLKEVPFLKVDHYQGSTVLEGRIFNILLQEKLIRKEAHNVWSNRQIKLEQEREILTDYELKLVKISREIGEREMSEVLRLGLQELNRISVSSKNLLENFKNIEIS